MSTKRKTQAEAESWTIDEIEADPSFGFLTITKTNIDGVACAFDLRCFKGTQDNPGPMLLRVRLHRHDSRKGGKSR